MTKTKLKKTKSDINQCAMCGALEGLMHHDICVERVIVELAEHKCLLPKHCWVHGRLICQSCLQGAQENELEKSGTPEGLLAKAARLQGEFWDALSDLEAALGFDVSGTEDLDGVDIESLREAAGVDDDDDDDDEDTEEEEAACREIVREQKGQEGSK